MPRRIITVLWLFACFFGITAAAETGFIPSMPTWQDIAFPAFGGFSPDPLETEPAAPPATPAARNVPEPYTKEEFPEWMRDLWRGGVIYIGSLPFTYFFTLEGFDIYRYASGGFDPTLAPWPFRTASEITYDEGDRFWIIGITLTASLLTAAADYLLGVIFDRGESP